MDTIASARINHLTISAVQLVRKAKSMSTLDAYMTYGVTKKQLHSMLINMFHFPQDYMDCISSYHLKHWTGEYFSFVLSDGAIKQTHNNIEEDYMVVYQGCTPYQVRKAREVKLSFRKPIDQFGLTNYVIVRILIDADGNKW